MTQPSAPEPGTGIDYEAIGEAAYDAYWSDQYDASGSDDERHSWEIGWESSGRAVVAALRDQGFVVVLAEDLDTYFFGDDPESRRNAFDRLNAARNAALVAAPESAEGEET